MTGFEPRTSGIGSVNSTNWVKTTAPNGPKVSTLMENIFLWKDYKICKALSCTGKQSQIFQKMFLPKMGFGCGKIFSHTAVHSEGNHFCKILFQLECAICFPIPTSRFSMRHYIIMNFKRFLVGILFFAKSCFNFNMCINFRIFKMHYIIVILTILYWAVLNRTQRLVKL